MIFIKPSSGFIIPDSCWFNLKFLMPPLSPLKRFAKDPSSSTVIPRKQLAGHSAALRGMKKSVTVVNFRGNHFSWIVALTRRCLLTRNELPGYDTRVQRDPELDFLIHATALGEAGLIETMGPVAHELRILPQGSNN